MEEKKNNCINEPEPLRLWMIKFEVKGVGLGCAVSKAPNVPSAIRELVSNGIYNGEQSLYLITSVEEIIVPPLSGLLAEEVVTYSQYR